MAKERSLLAHGYIPRPIDTREVRLPASLEPLTEQLAEHVHDLWSAGRLAQGWTAGEERDDTAKKHPCLIAYGDLSEQEKAYDRVTALGTLKAILALGYEIVPPPAQQTFSPG